MPLWINVGCGPHLAPPPWFNIDQNDSLYAENFSCSASQALERKPDLVAPAGSLPYGDWEVDRLYAGHLVEHLDLYGGEVFDVLGEFARVVKPGGEIMLVAPDLVKTAEMVWGRQRDWTWFWSAHGTAGRGNPNGKPYKDPKPGDVHQWSCSREAIYLLAASVFGAENCTSLSVDEIPGDWPVVARIPDQSVVLIRV